MYSTKLKNTKHVDNNAYITIGDPYHDPKANMFRQEDPKAKKTSEKPFGSKLRPMNAENGNFSKLTYTPSAFKETNGYLQSQPLDKRPKEFAFGSHDASRRDEFASNIATEQYRQTLKKEAMYMNKNANKELLETFQASGGSSGPPQKQLLSASGTLRRETLYDIGRNKVTEFDPKSTRDRFYKTVSDRDKNNGSYRPTSTVVGDAAWNTEYKPPSHGAASLVKNFFDNSHLKVHGI
jgi:hypothetical protein